jgi:hypothetical protein
MAEGRPGAGAQAEEARRRLARVALAALLVAAVVAGLRGEVRPLNFQRPLRVHALVVGIALEAVLAMLMIAVAIRRRRAPRDALLAARLRGVLGAALTVGLIVIPIALLLTNLPKSRSQHRPANPFRPAGRARTPPLRSTGPGLHLPIGGILTGLLILALVAAIVICVIVLRRRARHTWGAFLAPEDDDEENLREAVESGRAALGELDDARAAIIACYLAMERSLAGAGAARDVAETPDELLARAAGAGLVRGEAAGRLTALFYEARFSSHPLPASSKTAAQQALSEMAASLRARAAATPAAAGPAGTAPASTGEAAP